MTIPPKSLWIGGIHCGLVRTWEDVSRKLASEGIYIDAAELSRLGTESPSGFFLRASALGNAEARVAAVTAALGGGE